jgi:hypothetical protein
MSEVIAAVMGALVVRALAQLAVGLREIEGFDDATTRIVL